MKDESNSAATPNPAKGWWKHLRRGQTVPLAFVKIDRKGTTAEWCDFPAEEVELRRKHYSEAVESIAREVSAAEPLHWQGDGVMLFLTDRPEGPAPVRSFVAAQHLRKRVCVELNMAARIAIHAA